MIWISIQDTRENKSENYEKRISINIGLFKRLSDGAIKT